MKKFNITVNGKTYEVDVEEIKGASSAPRTVSSGPVAPTPTAPVAPKSAPAVEPKVSQEVPAGGNSVTAPMPGTVLDIKVNIGDTVNSGDVLMILEAMKMENEIMAPTSGKVSAISVTKGASVNGGDVLIVIE